MFGRKHVSLFILPAILLMLLAATFAQAKPWSFAVICDQRSEYESGKPNYSADGLSPYLGNIAGHLAKEKVDFVLIPGDLAVGKKKGSFPAPEVADMKVRWEKWKMAMAPVLKKFPSYLIRGNHDAAVKSLEEETALWRDMFPLPKDAVSSPTQGQKGLSYSFRHKGALFVGLDEYVGWDASNDKTTMDLEFLNKALSAKAAHKFVFTHQPVWYGDATEIAPTMGTTPEAFAEALDKGGVSTLFTGHVHTYQRAAKDGYGFEQMISGNGGAPLESAVASKDPAVRVLGHDDSRFGYAIVTVDGPKVTSKVMLTSDPADPAAKMTEFDLAKAPR